MSGSASERAAVVTASARSLPARMYSIDTEGMPNNDLHLAAEQISQGRRGATIGHVYHVDTRHRLE